MDWNRGVPLYTEVSSFQWIGIEEFHCIQKCPHFRELNRGPLLYTKGVFISGSWNRGALLYTEVFSFWGVGIEGLHCVFWSFLIVIYKLTFDLTKHN